MIYVRIFHRYMAMRFAKPFAFGLGLFSLLIFLGDLFDKMTKLAKSDAPMWIILQYLWLDVPYWAVRVIPLATLLAVLYAVTGFVQSGEWIAVQASGFRTRTFFRPLWVMAALVVVLSFAAQESVLPACYRRAQSLWNERIFPQWEFNEYKNVVLIGRPGQFITAKIFWVKEGRLESPMMDYANGASILREIIAAEARWDDALRAWVFYRGVDRAFGPGGKIVEKPFDELRTDLDVPPRQLVPRTKSPEEMSILEMLRYLRQVGHLGASRTEALAELHAKIAYPFSNLILCILGIPIALRLRSAGRVAGFAAALGVGFLYFWVIELGRAMGSSGRVPPWAAAWTANVLFGALAAWLYRRADA